MNIKFLYFRILLVRAVVSLAALTALTTSVQAHIIPPEHFHPAVESYRRMTFVLNLNPILWNDVVKDAAVIAEQIAEVDPALSKDYKKQIQQLTGDFIKAAEGSGEAPDAEARKQAARKIFELSTRTIAQFLVTQLDSASAAIDKGESSGTSLKTARALWEGFKHEIKATDQPAFNHLGIKWLEMSTALGTSGILGAGAVPAKAKPFKMAAGEISNYVNSNYGANYQAPDGYYQAPVGWLAPLPTKSSTFDYQARIPPKLPPGHNINKQVPRPRQILNMVTRGVDEGETPLIALGDMAFDSTFIFGEPTRSYQISCNTCHNKSITNPQFFHPRLVPSQWKY